jgi:hypothetical protein
MFTIEEMRGSLIVVRAAGHLSAADYAEFVPLFDRWASQVGRPVEMLLVLGPGFGWKPGGLWQDLKFNVRHRRTFSRIAVTGHKRWHRWITAASRLLFKAEIRYFGTGRLRADAWLQEVGTHS